nr:MAG: short-chain dehydrogenase [Bacteroidota bacterium]
MTLQGKNIVIIGGTTGMGLSAALTFINAGAHVLVTGKDAESAKAAAQRFGDAGIAVQSDATQPGTAEDAIHQCHDRYGSVDGLFHVAGGSGRRMGDGPLHELTLEAWNHTLAMNLTSMMLSNQAAVRYFLDHGRGGTILNMGSVLGFSPSPTYFSTHAYAAAKAAIVGFSKSIAAYYASKNIRVNVIAPGLIETPMAQRAAKDEQIMQFIRHKQPLDGGRIGNPGDVDGLALYFMSDGSRFTTGQVVAVDGGWSVSEGQYRSSES